MQKGTPYQSGQIGTKQICLLAHSARVVYSKKVDIKVIKRHLKSEAVFTIKQNVYRRSLRTLRRRRHR